MHCSNCGEEPISDAIFCANCGSRLVQAGVSAASDHGFVEETIDRSKLNNLIAEEKIPYETFASLPVNNEFSKQQFGGYELASWGLRAKGYLLDGLILALAYTAIYIVITILGFIGGSIYIGLIFLFYLFGLLLDLFFIVFGIFYQVFSIGGKFGQTPGMMIAGVRIVDKQSRESIGYGRAFLRLLVAGAIGTFTLGLGAIADYFLPLWDEQRQTIHDKAVGSLAIVEAPIPFGDAISKFVGALRRN